jgi:hypothetical protein
MATRLDYCALGAADELMAFIREHWSAGHVLSRSRALLDWQHRDEAAGRYNFLVARNDGGGIVGILGFIPSSRYDPALGAGDETIWLTTWKVIHGYSAGLGLMLLRELAARLKPKWIGTAGLNPQTRGIYDAMGYRTGALDRFYRLNEGTAGHRLADIPADWPPQPQPTGDGTLRALTEEETALDESDQAPRKTPALFRRRYLAHPFYDYRLYLAVTGNDSALIAMRTCGHEGASALRIVDLLGSAAALAGCGPAFDALLRESGAEYLDFYCSGAAEALAAAGFRRLARDEGAVLPSYFEPFERSNVDILYALKGPGERLVICKGDADQDRPNMLGDGTP